MQLEHLVAEWRELGRLDLEAAKFLMGMKPVPLEIVGFHCQQAVEKHLKAFDESFDDLKQPCLHLTEYAVKMRYPYPGTLDIKVIRTALALASAAVAFVVTRVSPLVLSDVTSGMNIGDNI